MTNVDSRMRRKNFQASKYGKTTVNLQWMNEYSDIGDEKNIVKQLTNLGSSSHLEIRDSPRKEEQEPKYRRKSVILKWLDTTVHLKDFKERKFNIFNLAKFTNRKMVLPVLMTKGMEALSL
jgi:hypothetical protein